MSSATERTTYHGVVSSSDAALNAVVIFVHFFSSDIWRTFTAVRDHNDLRRTKGTEGRKCPLIS